MQKDDLLVVIAECELANERLVNDAEAQIYEIN
jgi:hypothetical protein